MVNCLRYQPQGRTELSKDNPLCIGIVDAFVPARQFSARGVRATLGTNANTLYKPTQKGLAFVVTSATSTDYQQYGGTTSPLIIGGPMTMLSFYRLTSIPAGTARIAGTLITGGAGGYAFAPNGSNFRFIKGIGSSSIYFGSAVSTNPKIDIATVDSTGAVQYFENGVLATSGAGGSPMVSGSGTATFKIGTTGSDNSTPSEHYLHVVWNRVLSSSEIADITANPWQIFDSADWPEDTASLNIISFVCNSSGTSSVNATVQSVQDVTGSSVGSGGVQATVQTIYNINCGSVATSSVNASAAAVVGISCVSTGTSISDATMQMIKELFGSSSGTSTAAATSFAIKGFTGNASGGSSTNAVANAVKEFAGNASCVSTAGAITNAIQEFVANAYGNSTTVASTQGIWAIVAQANGTSTANASTNIDVVYIDIAGNASGNSSASASVQKLIDIVAHAAGTSTANAYTNGQVVHIEDGDGLSVTIVTDRYLTSIINKYKASMA